MNKFLSQLNLTAQERRIVAVIFMVVFVVLNYLFVWPSFGDWSSLNNQLDAMRRKIKTDYAYIQQDDATNGWRKQIEELTKREGGSVMAHPVDPQVQLQNTIREQERKTGVYIKSRHPGTVKTNAFFEEQSTAIALECEEPQLVNFLYQMGMDPAMIRVAVLNLQPADNNRYRLIATLTLTANYTKQQPAAVSESVAEKRPAAGPKRPGPMLPPGARPRGVPGPLEGPAGKHRHEGPLTPGGRKEWSPGRNPLMPGHRPQVPGRAASQ